MRGGGGGVQGCSGGAATPLDLHQLRVHGSGPGLRVGRSSLGDAGHSAPQEHGTENVHSAILCGVPWEVHEGRLTRGLKVGPRCLMESPARLPDPLWSLLLTVTVVTRRDDEFPLKSGPDTATTQLWTGPVSSPAFISSPIFGLAVPGGPKKTRRDWRPANQYWK